MTLESPLALKDLMVNTIAGSPLVWFFLSLIFLAWLGARLQMNNSTFLLMLFIFSIMMVEVIGIWVYVLALVIVGFIMFKTIASFMR